MTAQNKTIFRYTLDLKDKPEVILHLPKNSLPIAVHFFKEAPQVWVLEDQEPEKSEEYLISVFGTGWDIKQDPGQYLGSFIPEKNYIFHVFWKKLSNG